ncbi:MAG: chemotaxis protein CheX [Candidatus Sericytochromatia bacterium]|nr:chemotaxis protein CheX [Candidatus Sericytochromatia bacterium]
MAAVTQPTFNVAVINPFLSAAEEVFQQVTRQEMMTGAPSLQVAPFQSEGLTVYIGLTGQVLGDVYFCFAEDTARHVASAMMMGRPVHELNEVASSAIAELGNQIAGNAVTKLAEAGYNCNIAPPLTFGPGLEVTSRSPSTLVVAMPSSLGPLTLRLALWAI